MTDLQIQQQTPARQSTIGGARVPLSIERFLYRYVRWHRAVALVGNCFYASGVFVAVAMCEMAVDRLVALPRVVREFVLIADLLTATAILADAVFKLFRKIDYLQAAIAVESRTDQFDQRLITAASSAAEASAREVGLAERVRRDVADLIEQGVRLPRPPLRLIWTNASVSIAITAVAVLLGMWPPFAFPQLLERFQNPFADLSPAAVTRLEVLTGNTSVAEGHSVTISAAVRATVAGDVSVHLSDDGRTWNVWPMVRDPGGTFISVIPSVGRPLRYFVTAGDAASLIFDVQINRPPTVRDLQMQVIPPDYLHAPPSLVRQMQGLPPVPAGSRVVIDVAGSEPLAAVELVSPGVRVASEPTADPAIRRVRLVATHDQDLTVQLTAQNGAAGTSELHLRTIADRPPVVQVLGPDDFTQVSAADVVSVNYAASDDRGVARLDLQTRVNLNPLRTETLPVPGGARTAEGTQKLTIGSQRAVVGDVISFRLIVTDSAGQTASGEILHLLICSQPKNPVSPDAVGQASVCRAWAEKYSTLLDAAARSYDDAAGEHAADLLSDAADVSPLLERSLYQLLLDARTAGEAEALSNLIDDWAVCDAVTRFVLRTRMDAAAGRFWLSQVEQGRHNLRDWLETLATGRQAELLLADRAGMKAFTERELPKPPSESAFVAETRVKARASLDRALRLIELDPGASDVDEQLRGRADAATDLFASQEPTGLRLNDTPADEEDRRILAARLLAAAKAQTLRPDGDWSRASDLATHAAMLLDNAGPATAGIRSAFRANAASAVDDDARVDAIDLDRKRSHARPEAAASAARSIAAYRSLRGLQRKLTVLGSANPAVAGSFASERLAIAVASRLVLREACIDRLLSENLLSSTFRDQVRPVPLPAATSYSVAPSTNLPQFDAQLRAYFNGFKNAAEKGR